MKIKLILYAIAMLLIVVYGCQYPLANFSEGEILYRAKCLSCHNRIAPDSFDADAWRQYIEKYGDSMTGDEKKLLFDHLTSAQRPDPNLRQPQSSL